MAGTRTKTAKSATGGERVRLRIGNLAKAVLVSGQAYQDPKDALNEFVSNAADEYAEAGRHGERIRVVLRRKGRRPVIAIDDVGRGMSPDRLREVARNLFESTKAGDDRTLGREGDRPAGVPAARRALRRGVARRGQRRDVGAAAAARRGRRRPWPARRGAPARRRARPSISRARPRGAAGPDPAQGRRLPPAPPRPGARPGRLLDRGDRGSQPAELVTARGAGGHPAGTSPPSRRCGAGSSSRSTSRRPPIAGAASRSSAAPGRPSSTTSASSTSSTGAPGRRARSPGRSCSSRCSRRAGRRAVLPRPRRIPGVPRRRRRRRAARRPHRRTGAP